MLFVRAAEQPSPASVTRLALVGDELLPSRRRPCRHPTPMNPSVGHDQAKRTRAIYRLIIHNTSAHADPSMP